MSNQPATFSTYLHPTEGPEVVKIGFSWPGSIFGFFWAFIKKMPTVGASLLAIEAIHLLAQIYGSYWAVVGLLNTAAHLVVGAYGNNWKRRDLERRGYVQQGWVRAETGEAALAIFHASLEQATLNQLDGKLTDMSQKMDDMARQLSTLQEKFAIEQREIESGNLKGLTPPPLPDGLGPPGSNPGETEDTLNSPAHKEKAPIARREPELPKQ